MNYFMQMIEERIERTMNCPIKTPGTVETLAGIEAWLSSLPNQRPGKSGPMTETGVMYTEFSASAEARPDDVAMIERNVARSLFSQMMTYFRDNYAEGHAIHWRIPFEWEIIDHPQMVGHYDDLGPDRDLWTGRACHLDKNWKIIKGYARFAAVPEPMVKH